MKKNIIVLVLSCMFAATFLLAIFKITKDIKFSDEKLINSPNVSDVTDNIQTKLKVTSDELGKEWTESQYNDDQWKSVQIPKHRIVSESEFKDGNFAYYRIYIPRESFTKVWHLKDELFLGLQYVLFNKLDIYVNGIFYRSNTPTTAEEFILNIPLDEKRENLVAIKGYIKTGDSGINHRSRILVGKGAELNETHRLAYKKDSVYTLIFLMCKGSILFVFVLIYLVIKVDTYFEKSLMYGFFVICEEVITGNFLYKYLNLNEQVYLFNFVEIGIIVYLFLFLADVLEKKYSRKFLFFLILSLITISFGISFDLLNRSYIFNVDHLLRFWNLTLMTVLAFYISMSFKKDKILFSILGLSLGISIWSAVFSKHPGLNFKAFGNLFIFIMVAYQTFVLLRRQQDQLVEQEKDVAIGKTAAILAHDVRRPLDQMSFILGKISSGEATEDFIKVAKLDVESSLNSVNIQISDMMNYLRGKGVSLSPISFYSILYSSIKQISIIKKNAQINFNYDFNARSKILSEESKLGSILANLIANAFEAIHEIGGKDTGAITFVTTQKSDKLIFSIENDGPHIPEEFISKIFKPLSTLGKEKGTGLGLAAVHKTMKEHDGEITVENIHPKGVRFTLSFKVSDAVDSYELDVFKASSTEYEYKEPVKAVDIQKKQTIRIFLLDDDRYIYEYFLDIIKKQPFDVEMVHASELNRASEIISSKRFDLYILDYDLNSKKTGLDFYNTHLNFLKYGVVLHTNRDVGSFQNLTLPLCVKPMSREYFIQECERVLSSRQKILLVEDSKIMAFGWMAFHGKHNITWMSSPEEALKYIGSLSSEIDACVLDYYYEGSSINGEQLADSIKQLAPNIRIFICSSSDFTSDRYQVIKKNQYDIRLL